METSSLETEDRGAGGSAAGLAPEGAGQCLGEQSTLGQTQTLGPVVGRGCQAPTV